MATRTRDIAESVHEVVAAFDQAINYVRRIEDRKDSKEDPEDIQDLYKSLALGPTIVQGYFDADSKRLGRDYLTGDATAHFQLREVLFSLKSLVSDLQSALLGDKDLNCKELQHSSDTCRVNAGVCLGQLSQRLTETPDHSGLHLQSPPAYVSGVPSMSSPGLHYSPSQSTHSSGRARMPMTPDPLPPQRNLGPMWLSKEAVADDQRYAHHQRRSTEASLRDSFANWSETSQLFTDHDVDGLSLRRPSSHTLSPEDGALLSHTLLPENRPILLPGQLDLDRDSYASLDVSTGKHTPVRSPATSPQPERMQTRERFGPDDFSPIDPQVLGPLYPDQGGNRQSITSYALRALDGNHHGGIKPVQPDVRHAVTPQPLRLPHRLARTDSSEKQDMPLRKPIAQHPEDTFPGQQYSPLVQTSYPMEHPHYLISPPTHIDGQRVPLPPRNQSKPNSFANPNGVLNPLPPGAPYQISASVQRSMAGLQTRHHEIDGTPQYPSVNSVARPNSQPKSNVQSLALSKTPSNASSARSSRPAFSAVPQAQFVQHIQTHMAPIMPQQLRPPPPPPSLPLPPPPQPLQQVQQPTLSPPQASPRSPQQRQLTQISQKGPSVVSIPIPQNIPLNLPTDKDSHPFCKGAFRLLIGLTKKAFVSANRPVGMSAFITYWRCDKCLFEGPLHTAPGPLDKKGRPGKPEKIFDPTPRRCGPLSTAIVGPDGQGEGAGGVRYKWAFLAKCHVPLKNVPEGKLDGTFGSFGCIFCAAEGQARGWTGPNGSLTASHGLGTSDAASTFSGRSEHTPTSPGGSQSTATPIFGNIRMFMDHLQMHRKQEAWPCAEMQGRMKCILGRAAESGEDWEINFLPLE